MATIRFEGREYPAQPGESVLDCLLRNGEAIGHSCKAGLCQSCLLKAEGAGIPESAQQGLKDALALQGYFLSCRLRPEVDLEVTRGASQRVEAKITGLEWLSGTVLRVRLEARGFDYFAGQYCTLFREDGLARSYSLASLPSDPWLELHVRIVSKGAMSQWLSREETKGVRVALQGPAGNCFYIPGRPEEPLLLAGSGTGLAPLYGVLRDALAQGHTGPVRLFHGAQDEAGLYLREELEALSQKWLNFEYVPSLRSQEGDLDRRILAEIPRLSGWKGYFCGDPGLVNLLRRKAFLAGMASKSICADPFLPSVSS